MHDVAPAAAPPLSPPLSRALTALLALTAGVAVANIYYAQPLLPDLARAFGVAEASAGLLVTGTQLGYTAGLVLLVPLGDGMDRRRLMLGQCAALVAALAAAAAAPNFAVLAAASVAVGVASTLAQQAVPFAAELADERSRGRTVGTVMSGLLAGILLARTLSGTVGEHFGWRAVFALGAAVAAGLGVLLWRALPHSRPGTREGYGALFGSLLGLTRRYPALRRAATIQALLFAGFSAFWTTLALLLESRFGLGATAAGAFGVIGLVGVCVAPLAGRLADRRGPRGVVGAGIGLVLAGFVLVWAWPGLLGLAAGTVLLDGGIQLAMIANQTVVFALDPAARSRVNTVFMTALFLGASLGSAGGSAAWAWGGWPAVCGLSALLTAAALVAHLTGRYPAR